MEQAASMQLELFPPEKREPTPKGGLLIAPGWEINPQDNRVNPVRLCNYYGSGSKPWANFETNNAHQEFLQCLSNDTGWPIRRPKSTPGIPVSRKCLIEPAQSRYDTTWIHPELAIKVMAWLQPKFEVMAYRLVHRLLSGSLQLTPTTQAPPPPDAHEIQLRYDGLYAYKVAMDEFDTWMATKGVYDCWLKRIVGHRLNNMCHRFQGGTRTYMKAIGRPRDPMVKFMARDPLVRRFSALEMIRTMFRRLNCSGMSVGDQRRAIFAKLREMEMVLEEYFPAKSEELINIAKGCEREHAMEVLRASHAIEPLSGEHTPLALPALVTQVPAKKRRPTTAMPSPSPTPDRTFA